MTNDKRMSADEVKEAVVEAAVNANKGTTHPMTEQDKADLREYIETHVMLSNRNPDGTGDTSAS